MATVPMDVHKVARCRAIAAEIATDVQRYIDTHTTVGVERRTNPFVGENAGLYRLG